MLHGRKEVSFVSIIMFILHPDALSLNGSVMINQSINHNMPLPKWPGYSELVVKNKSVQGSVG
jgi:hypothetical protein